MDMSTMTMVGVAVAFMVVAVGLVLAVMTGVRWVAGRADPVRTDPVRAALTGAGQVEMDRPGVLEPTSPLTDRRDP